MAKDSMPIEAKIQVYGWKPIPDEPGKLAYVDKNEPIVDHSYQRPENLARARRIAANFEWDKFGVAILKRRPDGVLAAVDAQTRILAARLRSDVTTIPAIISASGGLGDEAGAFSGCNDRKVVDSISKHKSNVLQGNPAALLVQSMADKYGRRFRASRASDTIECVRRLESYAETDPDRLQKVWPLAMELTTGSVLGERLICGLMYIDARASGASVVDARWYKRFVAVGLDTLNASMAAASAAWKRGGERVWANGLLEAVNRNLREENRLRLREE